MKTTFRTLGLTLLVTVLGLGPAWSQQSRLEAALGDLYAACLFEGTGAGNPFSEAVGLARQSLAPGLANFIESNLAAIPLTPPSLDAEYVDGEIVTTVAGFSPIFTESSSTVGGGQFMMGTNFSYFSMNRIRGEDLSDISFAFEQNGGGDLIFVDMPLNIDAAVFTLHGTYGITDRLDVGFALPIVNLTIQNGGTNFRVEGSQTSCRYEAGGAGANCSGIGTRDINVNLNSFADHSFESETYLSTLALRAKYRLPGNPATGSMAAVLDMRVPVGRGEGSMLGTGNFGARLTFIGEYNRLGSFKPYLNLGGQIWDGANSSSLKFAAGFNQQVASKLFFAFDLLGEMDFEPDPFLSSIDNSRTGTATQAELALTGSSIPSVDREHTLNAAIGMQLALAPGFHAYGSALFALLDAGLQASIAPTVGLAVHF